MVYYCLCCGERILSNLAFRNKGEDFYHFRQIQTGKPEVIKCGPIDCYEENEIENRKEEFDESEINF